MKNKQITLMETRSFLLRNMGNVIIYMLLSDLSMTNPRLQISIDELASMTNMTYSTVLNHLNELRDLGFVERSVSDTLPKTNVFIVHPINPQLV